jgi:XTP/dITP diphosphohydrolase
MKKIIFATSNKGKYNSARTFLAKYGIKVIQKSLKIPEPRGSLEEIAIQKAKYAFRILKKPLITMDAGFFIPSLGGFPMMFTNFVLDTIGIDGILKLVDGKNRNCEFREVLCYYDNIRLKLFKRIVKGKIAKAPRGKVKPYHWSKLFLIFIPEGETKTIAQMSKQEFMNFRKRVNKNSHWEQFAKFYLDL